MLKTKRDTFRSLPDEMAHGSFMRAGSSERGQSRRVKHSVRYRSVVGGLSRLWPLDAHDPIIPAHGGRSSSGSWSEVKLASLCSYLRSICSQLPTRQVTGPLSASREPFEALPEPLVQIGSREALSRLSHCYRTRPPRRPWSGSTDLSPRFTRPHSSPETAVHLCEKVDNCRISQCIAPPPARLRPLPAARYGSLRGPRCIVPRRPRHETQSSQRVEVKSSTSSKTGSSLR